MHLSQEERYVFQQIAKEFIIHETFHEMKQYIQHGKTSTYTHSLYVAYYSYWLMKRLPLSFSESALIRGALLHDLYLYDWHKKDRSHKWHGFHHPKTAHDNALLHFSLNEIERNIILAHMWPLTFRHFPRYREAIAVCMVDKAISLCETFHVRMANPFS